MNEERAVDADAARMEPGDARVFLLSPANCGGLRARMLMRRQATFELACRLREPPGVELGEVFAFMSSLYFRGKLAYARRFAKPPESVAGIQIITPDRGLVAADHAVMLEDLRRLSRVDIDRADPRYARVLTRAARALARAVGPDCDVVLLGSIATPKYTEILLQAFGPRLRFPLDFVGRGDMSRGGLMLRCVRSGGELEYGSVQGAVRRGRRPPKLERERP